MLSCPGEAAESEARPAAASKPFAPTAKKKKKKNLDTNEGLRGRVTCYLLSVVHGRQLFHANVSAA